MKVTTHASKRLQQRGIKDMYVMLIHMFGDVTESNTGVEKIQLREKTRRSLIQSLDKCQNKVIIVDRDLNGTLITAYALSGKRKRRSRCERPREMSPKRLQNLSHR